MKPDSIRKFSRFFLASVVVMFAATLVDFDVWVAEAEFRAGERMGFGVMLASLALWAAILFLLWYLVARKGFAIGKWIFVLFFLLNLVATYGVFAGGLTLPEAAALASLVLQAAAVYYLFQPDAKAWFGGERAADAPQED